MGQKAKTMDARQKLEKIRNLRHGNLEVKKVGGITVTKKVGGGIILSTKTRMTKVCQYGDAEARRYRDA